MKLSILLAIILTAGLFQANSQPTAVGKDDSDVCLKQVACQDEAVASESASDVTDCWRKCRKNSKCSFYTLNSDTCSLYETCQEVNEDASALTGHVMCTPKKDFRVYLRNPDQSLQYSPTDDDIECPIPVDDEYDTNYIATVENKVTFCSTYDPPTPCYSFNPATSTWEKSITMPEAIIYGASLQSLDEKRWFIFGGEIPFDEYVDNVLRWEEGSEEFSVVENLDSPVAGACISRINRTHSLLTGGYDETGLLSRVRFVIESEDKLEFVETNAMFDNWSLHACGTHYREDGRVEIIVSKAANECEIFDVESQQWRKGPFPGFQHVNTRHTVPYQNTFKVFGNLARPNDVLTYDGEGGWVIESSVLEESFQRGEAKQVFRDQICP